MINSFLSKTSIKKLIDPIKKINGKSSKRIEDELRKVRYTGTKILTFKFLKKTIS